MPMFKKKLEAYRGYKNEFKELKAEIFETEKEALLASY
jgi:hypothetical protein